MKNKLMDLNNALFEQLDRLGDTDLDLKDEVRRAQAMAGVADRIIENADLALRAVKIISNSPALIDAPEMIGIEGLKI